MPSRSDVIAERFEEHALAETRLKWGSAIAPSPIESSVPAEAVSRRFDELERMVCALRNESRGHLLALKHAQARYGRLKIATILILSIASAGFVAKWVFMSNSSTATNPQSGS